MSIKVLKPGMLTTVQDLGRTGFQQFGVVAGGAMDPFALRVANLLVGNDENAPALEITMSGPVLEMGSDSLLSVCGGDLSPTVDGCALPMWRPVLLPAGSTLSFGSPVSGCRAYAAVAGGVHVPRVLGSGSTYLRAGLGGWEGRALREGDEVPVGHGSALAERWLRELSARSDTGERPYGAPAWFVGGGVLPRYECRVVRAMYGRQHDWFDSESWARFWNEPFIVSPQSDRMGYRLTGPSLLLSEPRELLSTAVSFGTIQVPPDGRPIVLMADRQTTGGYPQIAYVAGVDLPIMAQLKPGDTIQFTPVSVREAQMQLLETELELRQLKLALKHRFASSK